jgi:hypothetical protein
VYSNPDSELYLQSVRVNSGSTQVRYTFTTKGSEYCYLAEMSDVRGIRSIVIPEDLETFLNPYLAVDPHLIKKLVAETWRLASDKQPFTPLRLV